MKIVADYHTHTVSSDGKNSVQEMVAAASAVGLTEIAITDHGHGKIASRLLPKHYDAHKALIEKAGREHNITTLFGIEANIIGTNGQIDVSPDDRAHLDILLCGVHRYIRPANLRSLFGFFLPNMFWKVLHYTPKRRIARNTEVVKRAIERNDIDILTHPNLYFKTDVVEVARTCAARGTLMELNGDRISFRPIDFERMLAVGAKFIINSDAHSAKHVGEVTRVFEFLKNCDFKEEDIVNLHSVFKYHEKTPIKNSETKSEISQEVKNDISTSPESEQL